MFGALTKQALIQLNVKCATAATTSAVANSNK